MIIYFWFFFLSLFVFFCVVFDFWSFFLWILFWKIESVMTFIKINKCDFIPCFIFKLLKNMSFFNQLNHILNIQVFSLSHYNNSFKECWLNVIFLLFLIVFLYVSNNDWYYYINIFWECIIIINKSMKSLSFWHCWIDISWI